MDSGEDPPRFPYEIIWEEFAPAMLNWETLEGDRTNFDDLFFLIRSSHTDLPVVSAEMLNDMASKALSRLPSTNLVSKLYLLAGWRLTSEFWKQFKIDLASQRLELKKLEKAAFALWKATNGLSTHSAAVLPWLHSLEPNRLVPKGRELNVSDVGQAAYDLSLVAARAYSDTQPETGRQPEFRRDTVVHMAAEVIEKETGEAIQTSRGNKADPSPHFTNAGGMLLREFLKLLEPKTDERLVVQSLARVRRRSRVQNNSLNEG